MQFVRQQNASDKPGRPWVSHRRVINGILWVLCSGARWKDIPIQKDIELRKRIAPFQRSLRIWLRQQSRRQGVRKDKQSGDKAIQP